MRPLQRAYLLLSIGVCFVFIAPTLTVAQQLAVEHISMPPAQWNDRLPQKVDFSRDMPKPGNQGSQGSCVGWSIAYYKSFQEHRERGWDYSDNTIFSPSYIYNQKATSLDSGMVTEDGFKILVEQGIATKTAFPYTETDWQTKPSNDVTKAASKYKAASYLKFPSTGNRLVNALREHLATGDAAVMDFPIIVTGYGRVFRWYLGLSRDVPTVIDIPSSADLVNLSDLNKPGYRHAVTLVGYDDEKMRFKFINSWGEGWGESGFGYLTYGFVTEFPLLAYTMQDVIAPDSISKYDARLNRRPDIPVLQPGQTAKIVIGLQNTSNTPWLTDGRIKLERISGEELGVHSPQRFEQPIPMGGTLVFTMTVSAPNKPGVYDSNWQITSKDGPFGDRIPISVVVVPEGSSIGLQEIIQKTIEEERKKWQAEFDKRWEDLKRQIMERIEEEIRREVRRQLNAVCGVVPAGIVVAFGVVLRRRRL